jgi:hypothetical protein
VANTSDVQAISNNLSGIILGRSTAYSPPFFWRQLAPHIIISLGNYTDWNVRELVIVEPKKQRFPFCWALLFILNWSTCVPVLAINPAFWTASLSTSGNDAFWTSPTNVDPDFDSYDWSYTITRADVGWRWGLLSNTYNALGDLGNDFTGSGSTSGLPAVILDETFALEGSGATVQLEINSQGYGRASITDVSLGTISVDAGFFGTITANIESIDFTAEATVVGIPAPPTDFQWAATSTGRWHNPNSWSPAGVPNGNDNTVVFTGTGPSVTNVLIDSPATVRELAFDGPGSYQLNGNNTLTLDADIGTTRLSVAGGNHNSSSPVSADATTNVDIVSGAELALEGRFDFANQTVTKTGLGHLYLDSALTAGIGTLQHNGGLLGGEGTVNGNLITNAAAIAPGHNIGQLTVGGDFTMDAGSVLEIEIGGAATHQFDTLQVANNAYLNGTLAVTLSDDYSPEFGERFPIVQATGLSNRGMVLGGPDAEKFKLIFSLGQLLLESTVVDLSGDYNNDGRVDAADYTSWRNHLGTTTLPNRDPNATGPVGQFDYLVWKANFGNISTSSAAVVPEPGSLLLTLLVTLVGITMWTRPTWSSISL